MTSDSMHRRQAAVIGLLALLVRCSGDPPTGVVKRPTGMLVSNPLVSHAAPAPSRLTTSVRAAGTVGEDTMVYVALEPGTAPATGVTATVRGLASGATATTAVQDGGFDPVPVTARAGDVVEVTVRDASGAEVFRASQAVPIIRRLVVVRTDPSPGRRDQPLNGSLIIVFSEPVASASLTASAVQLSRGNTAVAGSVSLLQGSGTTVAFTPAARLAPNTDYVLLVTTVVTDLDGDPLDAPITVTFRTGVSSTGPPASISVSPDTIQMTGGTYQLVATVRDAARNVLVGQPVTWSSSDPNGLAVSATGLVTAVATGSYDVTAASNGLTAAARVVVAAGLPALVTISPAPATVGAEGDTIKLSATVRDGRDRVITYPSMTWTSSAPTVASVAQTSGDIGPAAATVTGVSLGSATIRATAGPASGTVLVTVTTPPPAGSVTVTPASATMLVRMSKRLSASVRDANGRVLPGRPVAWSTVPASVATVDATGLVTGVDSGSAAVIATSGDVSDTTSVTVVAIHFASVVAGGGHSCGIRTDGAAYCWGDNGNGQLGDGTHVSRPIPAAVAGGLSFATLSASSYETCGLTTGRAAYCWGYNIEGQVGDSTTASSAVPVAVAGTLTLSAVVASDYHACVLTVSGAAYCWGTNWTGQLGDGSFTSSPVPVAVTGGLTFTALAVGANHTCGIASGDKPYCWGFNRDGQLGDGTRIPSAAPVAVTGGLTLSAIAAGFSQTCGVTPGGTAYCWGGGFSDTLSPTPPPPPEVVPGGLSFIAVTVGQGHACGITTLGAAYCWGFNYAGQLGDGSTTDTSTPVAVAGGLTFSALSARGANTCGFASGVAYCWGDNGSGQLGDGSTASRSVPVRVAGQP